MEIQFARLAKVKNPDRNYRDGVPTYGKLPSCFKLDATIRVGPEETTLLKVKAVLRRRLHG